MLPEGQHLQALSSIAGVASNDSFALLRRFGRDVAGALVITDGDTAPDTSRWATAPYTDEELLADVRGLTDGALAVRDDSELSIAGLQDKMLLVATDDGGWARPIGGHPSTHILKVDDQRYPGLVAAEAECLQLATCIGLGNLDPVIRTLDGHTTLTIRRFDREVTATGLRRIHQEDACQALGIDPEGARGRTEYESSGGPTWLRIAQLLRDYATHPDEEMVKLLKLATFTLLIGNADGHGKNVSFLHHEDGSITLSPAYDTVPTVLWPNLRKTMAMSIAGNVSADHINTEQLVQEASSWGLDQGVSTTTVIETVETIRDTAHTTAHVDALVHRITERATQLLRTDH